MTSNHPATETPPWIATSRAFLQYLEAEGEGATADLQSHLAALIAVAEATALPDLQDDQDHDPEVHTEAYWSEHAARRFPTLGAYPTADGAYGDAAGDLAELALELEQSLAIAQAGKPELGLWEWRFGYDTHWGWAHAQPLMQYLETLEA